MTKLKTRNLAKPNCLLHHFISKVSKIAYHGGLMFFNFLDLKLYLALRTQRPAEASAGGRGSLRLETLLRFRRCITRMLILSTQHTQQSVYSCQRATHAVTHTVACRNMQSDGIATLLLVLCYFSFLIDILLCDKLIQQ